MLHSAASLLWLHRSWKRPQVDTKPLLQLPPVKLRFTPPAVNASGLPAMPSLPALPGERPPAESESKRRGLGKVRSKRVATDKLPRPAEVAPSQDVFNFWNPDLNRTDR